MASDNQPAPQPGVNLVGYLQATLGIGQVARQVLLALRAARVPVASVALPARNSVESPLDHEGLTSADDAGYPLNLVCVNADGLEGAASLLGENFFADRPTVGWWWWETDSFPARWLRAFDRLDEVWVGSSFVADALSAVSPVPVVPMPMPVSVAPAREVPALGLPAGFRFLAMVDYGSVVARKNPRGALDAFARIASDHPDARLIIKTVGAERHPEAHRSLCAAASAVAGASVIDATLDNPGKDALIGACDCFVSLHRSEGFGLPIAEALLLERPVIATGYGGAMDYLTPWNAFLVDWTETPIGPGHDPYPEDGVWAEPDLDGAVAAMEAVLSDRAGAAARARRGRLDIERSHSVGVAGAAMSRRLARIAGGPSEGHRIRRIDFDELAHRIRSGAPQPAPDVSLQRARTVARGIILRATQVQAAHSRQVDEEVLSILRTLEEELGGLALTQSTLQSQLDALERRMDGATGR